MANPKGTKARTEPSPSGALRDNDSEVRCNHEGPLDLYDHPANLFVAGFIGSPAMNLLNGQVQQGPKGFVFRANGGTMFRVPEAAGQLAQNREVVVGIRPEHVELGGADNAVEAEVVVDEPTGSETQVALIVGQDSLLAVFRDRVAVSAGQRLAISLPPSPYPSF